MKQLRKLDLSEVPGISDEGLANLRRMQELVWLNLWNTRVGNAGMEHIAKLSKLVYLNLDNTGVDDEGLKPLAALPKLETLIAQSNVGHRRWPGEFELVPFAEEARAAPHRREQEGRRQIEAGVAEAAGRRTTNSVSRQSVDRVQARRSRTVNARASLDQGTIVSSPKGRL